MNIFEFRDELVREHTRIRAAYIKTVGNKAYESGLYRPSPHIQLGPNSLQGGSTTELVNRGLLHRECKNIFRVKGADGSLGPVFDLYRHQVGAIKAAKRKKSYVLTAGIGSGKSLSYFVHIVDDVLRRGVLGQELRRQSYYPMNTLRNSQREELAKYLLHGYGKGKGAVTLARYTGHSTPDERAAIIKNPADKLTSCSNWS